LNRKKKQISYEQEYSNLLKFAIEPAMKAGLDIPFPHLPLFHEDSVDVSNTVDAYSKNFR
jgi:hypothetical protein